MKGLTLSSLLLAVVLAGCDRSVPTDSDSRQSESAQTAGTDTERTAAVPDPAHNARNSLDWAGTYQGMLPCADCEAINTELTLHDDGGYSLSRQYVGKSAQQFTEQGQFSWNSAGNTVLLDTEPLQQFFVGENQLFMLDQQGQRIEGDLAARYRLQKQP